MWYVYMYIEISTGKVRYVGCTNNLSGRRYSHERQNPPECTGNKSYGQYHPDKFKFRIVGDYDEEVHALNFEKWLIYRHQWTVNNVQHNPLSSYSPEQRERVGDQSMKVFGIPDLSK